MPASKATKKTASKKANAKTAKAKVEQSEQPVDNQNEMDAVTIDRRREDRREADEPKATNAPRPKKQRRRHIDPTTCERDYSGDEIEFMRAMDDYKHNSGRMFPTCSEVLEVIRSLGYMRLNEEQAALLQIHEIVDDIDDCYEAEDAQEEELEDVFGG